MDIVKLRMTDHIVAVKDADWPVKHRHHVPAIDFTIEARFKTSRDGSLVYAWVVREGITHYAGESNDGYYLNYHHRYQQISQSAFGLAKILEVPIEHVWGFVEQFPIYIGGESLEEAEIYEAPVLDLVARGVDALEVIRSLGITRGMYQLITGTFPPANDPVADANIWDDGDEATPMPAERF